MTQKGCFKRGPGRPTKFSPAIAKRIVDAVRMGNYLETAAGLAGLSKETLREWLTQGARMRETDPATLTIEQKRRVDFSVSVEKAILEAEERDLARVDLAAQGYDVEKVKTVESPTGSETTITKEKRFEWQAAAWRLERRSPKKWGRRLDVNAGISASPLDDRSDEDLLRIIAAGELGAGELELNPAEDETNANGNE